MTVVRIIRYGRNKGINDIMLSIGVGFTTKKGVGVESQDDRDKT